MSRLEKGLRNSAKLGRDLVEMNNSAMVKIVELSAENFKKYLELNQSYMTKLPEVRDISSFVELQRDYGQSLWEGVQADLKARGEIVRDTVEQTGSLVRNTFADSPVDEARNKVAEAVAA